MCGRRPNTPTINLQCVWTSGEENVLGFYKLFTLVKVLSWNFGKFSRWAFQQSDLLILSEKFAFNMKNQKSLQEECLKCVWKCCCWIFTLRRNVVKMTKITPSSHSPKAQFCVVAGEKIQSSGRLPKAKVFNSVRIKLTFRRYLD